MSTYSPVLSDIPTGLDEVGYRLGLPRLTHETSAAYRMRLLGFAKDPPTPDEKWFRRQASNLLGRLSVNVIDIDLVLDGDGVPVAPDPRVEITVTKMILWSDYASGVPLLTCNLFGSERLLIDLASALLTVSAYFTFTAPPQEYAFQLSKNLRVSNSDGWEASEALSPRKVHQFAHGYIVDIFPEIPRAFTKEEATVAAVDEAGDYCLNRVTGVLNHYSPMGGRCQYSYWDFPFRVWSDPVRVLSLADHDMVDLTEVTVRGDLGSDVPGGLPTKLGATIYNELLSVYPLEWGE